MNVNAKEFIMTETTSNNRIKRRNIEVESRNVELQIRNTELELRIKTLEDRIKQLEKFADESTDAIFMYEMKLCKLMK